MTLSAEQRLTLGRKMYHAMKSGKLDVSQVQQEYADGLYRKEWDGIPLAKGIHPATYYNFFDAIDMAGQGGALYSNVTVKASDVLDSTSGQGGPLIRTDLESRLYSLFLMEFPGFDSFPKEPANGLTHTFVQRTQVGALGTDTKFLATDLTQAPFGQGVYRQKASTNIGIGITERGASLKEVLAVQQSGMNYGDGNVALTEVDGGLIDLTYLFQRQLYQGVADASGSGKTGTDEFGIYDANGFDGFRFILSGNAAAGYYPTTGLSPATSFANVTEAASGLTIIQALNKGVRKARDNGGRIGVFHMSGAAAETLAKEGTPLMRIGTGEAGALTLGVAVDAVQTVYGRVPIVVVPGDSIGNYLSTSLASINSVASGFPSGIYVEDIYGFDTRSVSMPYLGTDRPTTIEIPMGVDGKLGLRYLIFAMFGLAVKAPMQQMKVRVQYPDNVAIN